METIRKCSVCGKEKPVSEFSKSYPNRCKECVAENTRKVRKEAKEGKMRTGSLTVGLELSKEDVKQFIKDSIDERAWEQRRYEIAKDIYVRMLHDDTLGKGCLIAEASAHQAVDYADALITELKERR